MVAQNQTFFRQVEESRKQEAQHRILVVLDTQVPTIEKSHSSPSTSKPSPSEGQARSHGTPRTHGKSVASRAHPDDTMATAEAASEHHRLQPSKRRK